MPTTDRIKAIGRKESGQYIGLPYAVLRTRKYAQLSGWACKLIMDLFIQFNGKNNGDFSAAWSIMKQRGWRSKGTLSDALKELLDAGIINKTRQGGKNHCSLYGMSWLAIDYCPNSRTGKHKLDQPVTRVALGTWRDDH